MSCQSRSNIGFSSSTILVSKTSSLGLLEEVAVVTLTDLTQIREMSSSLHFGSDSSNNDSIAGVTEPGQVKGDEMRC